MIGVVLIVALAFAACTGESEPRWQLDHDRIIAVRATPPRIQPGEQSTIDVLLGFTGAPTAVRAPDQVWVISPESLKNVVVADAGRWVVTAPGEDALAAARAELKLAPGEPVPLRLGVSVRWPHPVMSPDGETFTAIKEVWLGDTAQNPDLSTMSMLVNNAAPPDGSEVVVPKNTRVPLYIDADETVDSINWLSSCGELDDSSLHAAYLFVAPDSVQQGQLGIVFRDGRGGVAWRLWQIRAE